MSPSLTFNEDYRDDSFCKTRMSLPILALSVLNRHNRPIGAHFHSGGAKFPYLGEDLYEAFG
jgi:hypothetical protein